jgi:hypothetical protein
MINSLDKEVETLKAKDQYNSVNSKDHKVEQQQH